MFGSQSSEEASIEDQFVVTTLIEKPFNLISKPFNNSVYKIDPSSPRDKQKLVFKSPYAVTWFVDGEEIGQDQKIAWQLQPGQHRIKAVQGKQEEVVVIYVIE